MNPLYDILVQGVALAALPVLASRARWREGLGQRFGRWPAEVRARANPAPVVWVHAASVGEVNAARFLIERLFESCPEHGFLVTTTTTTGRARAEALFGTRAGVALLPLDSYAALAPVLKSIRPQAVLVFETELWPRFLSLAKKEGAHVIMVNGRISSRSFRRYRRLKPFMRPLLANFDLLLMNGADSAERILALGASKERVETLGNVKWAARPQDASHVHISGWEGRPIIVAGSTHAGEEEIILRCFMKLQKRHPDLRLAIAPRHLQRLPEVKGLLEASDLSWSLRTEVSAGGDGGDGGERAKGMGDANVLLIDTMGELAGFYALATLAFVGGSLIPRGGHNMLEPAACGVASLYGPHIDNFSEIAQMLEDGGGAVRVADEASFLAEASRLLDNPELRREMGRKALATVAEQRGIVERYIERLLPYLQDEKAR